MVTPQSRAALTVVYAFAAPLGGLAICSAYVPSPTIKVSPPAIEEIPRAMVAHGLFSLWQLLPLSVPDLATYSVAAFATDNHPRESATASVPALRARMTIGHHYRPFFRSSGAGSGAGAGGT